MTAPSTQLHHGADAASQPQTRTIANLDLTASAPFLLKDRTYTQQYANLYFSRLQKLRPHVVAAANRKWGSVMERGTVRHVERVVDIRPKSTVWIVGTLFCEMPLKPNILDDIASEYGSALPPPHREKIYSEKDVVMLEDEYGRVRLEGPLLANYSVVTGTVAAVLGSENAQGGFDVLDLCYAGLPSLTSPVPEGNDGPWVGFVSGFRFGAADADLLAAQMLSDYVAGELGCDEDLDLLHRVGRIFVVGNVIEAEHVEKGLPEADAYLAQMAATVPVTVLPGPVDPATHVLPQQPMHPSLFAQASKHSEFLSVPNPLFVQCAGFPLAVTSGQPLDDLFKYVPGDDRLALARRMLDWRHIAPTAPDTLWCYPYVDDDPFVLPERSRLLVVGNQPEFATCIYEDPTDAENTDPDAMDTDDAPPSPSSVRVLLLPEFTRAKLLVLVNLATLAIRTVQFG
ncbi:hypothetical protein GGF31_002683 [Allomyces arbusculus]|nr:hypothetical protein GGF31_002683 [Allomyces arbusculus]